MKYFTWLAILASGCFVYKDVWWPPWFGFEFIVLAYFAYKIWDRVGKLPGLTFGYFTLQPLILGSWTPLAAGKTLVEAQALRHMTLEAIVAALCLTLFAENIAKCLPTARRAFAVLWVIVGASLALTYRRSDQWHSILGSLTMSGCYMAMALPMVEFPYLIWACIFAIPAIAMQNSATAWTALILVGMTGMWMVTEKGLRQLLTVVFMSSWFVSILHVKGSAFMPQDRYSMWKTLLAVWYREGNWARYLFGWGRGTYKLYGPAIQSKYQFLGQSGHELWLWPHNDWLQILLEGGLVGGLLSGCLFLSVLGHFNRRRDIPHTAATMAFGFVMVTNYPGNLAIFATFGAYLICNSYLGVTDVMDEKSWVKKKEIK